MNNHKELQKLSNKLSDVDLQKEKISFKTQQLEDDKKMLQDKLDRLEQELLQKAETDINL